MAVGFGLVERMVQFAGDTGDSRVKVDAEENKNMLMFLLMSILSVQFQKVMSCITKKGIGPFVSILGI